METNKPIHEIKSGSIKASIWENKGKDKSFFSVTIVKSYKSKKDNAWKNTTAFNDYDLAEILKVITDTKAYLGDRAN